MKTERNAIFRRPSLDSGKHPNMELKGIYSFMEQILQEITKLSNEISQLREDIFEDEVDIESE